MSLVRKRYTERKSVKMENTWTVPFKSLSMILSLTLFPLDLLEKMMMELFFLSASRDAREPNKDCLLYSI